MKKIYLFFFVFTMFNLSSGQNVDGFVSLFANINPGDANGVPSNFIEFNGEVFFSANDGSTGLELWKIDSGLNVSLVQDIRPGSDGSFVNNFIVYNNKLYFTAFNVNSGPGGIDLYSTDGTTVTEESLYASNFSGLFNPIELNGKLYYTGFNSIGNNNRLIEYDGTTGNEVLDVGSGEEAIIGGNTFAYNDKILLYMNYSSESANFGTELYEYDPVAQTFTLIKDIDPGSASSSVSNFVLLDGEVYFEAENEVWKTDGTPSGTVQVSAIANQNIGSVNNFFVWNGELYFEGDNGVNGDELWKYNPTADVVVQLSNISGANGDHDPSAFEVVDSPLLPMEILAYSGEPGTDNDSRMFSTNGALVFQLTNQYIDVDHIFYWPSQELVLFQAEEIDAGGNDIVGSELYAYDLNTLSTQDQTLDDIVIYPNPVRGTIFIQSGHHFDSYAIFDINGREVQSGTDVIDTIDLNLSSGVYILNLSHNNQVSTHKIIVK
jgi:ELWxxDGT repeat protein